MKLSLLLTLTLLTSVATATSVDFANQGGKISVVNGDLVLTGSPIVSVQIGSITTTGNLGTIAFSTGSLFKGTLQQGGDFKAGGTFVITGSASNPLHSGTIFTGSFDGPAQWQLITLANGTHSYTLVGTLSGTWFNGTTVVGLSVQLTTNTGKGFFNRSGGHDGSGDTAFAGVTGVVPEPSSLMMLGTGLVGLAGVTRNKLKKLVA